MGNRALTLGRSLLAVTLATLALGATGTAQAATTGSSLTGNSSPVTCAVNTTCILSQGNLDGDPLNNVIGQAGTVTGFTFRHVTGDVAFVVLRENASGIAVVGSTGSVAGSGDDEEESYTLNTPIAVRQGDFIGLSLAEGASVGARSASGEQTNVLELTDVDAPEVVGNDQAAELFLQATYEPTDTGQGPDPDPELDDATVTPLPDPLASLRAGKRPKVMISGKAVKASKKGLVKIRVRNPNGYKVKGRMALKAKRLKLGGKAFSIAADATKTVTIRLSGKARSRLARRGKLKTSVSATFKGPIGKAGSAKKTLTIKAPPKPKKKRRQTGGGGGGGGGGLFRPPLCVPHIEYDADGWAHAIPC